MLLLRNSSLTTICVEVATKISTESKKHETSAIC